MEKRKIAVFASGKGSNAQEIVKQSSTLNFEVTLIVSNKKNAPILAFAKENDIQTIILSRKTFYNEESKIGAVFQNKKIELLVLAGFLWLIPDHLINAFPNKIINIHPSLLPKYGGKGMYGINVHQAVFENKEKESGITIHLVSEEYDKGEILKQEKVDVKHCDSADEIAKKVLCIEHKNYAKTINDYIAKLVD